MNSEEGSSNKLPSTSWTQLQHVDGNLSPKRATFNKLPATSRLLSPPTSRQQHVEGDKSSERATCHLQHVAFYMLKSTCCSFRRHVEACCFQQVDSVDWALVSRTSDKTISKPLWIMTIDHIKYKLSAHLKSLKIPPNWKSPDAEILWHYSLPTSKFLAIR